MADRDAHEGFAGTDGSGMNDGPSAPREVGDSEGLSGPAGARGRVDGSDIGNSSDIGALGGSGSARLPDAGGQDESGGVRERGASGGR